MLTLNFDDNLKNHKLWIKDSESLYTKQYSRCVKYKKIKIKIEKNTFYLVFFYNKKNGKIYFCNSIYDFSIWKSTKDFCPQVQLVTKYLIELKFLSSTN